MAMKSWALGGLVLAAVTGAAMVAPVLAQTAPAEQGMGMGDGMGPMAGRGMGGFDFAAVDADKDGRVTKAELDAWRAAAATRLDADGDGLLSADEIAAGRIEDMTARAQQMAARMVERLDADGDGLLSAAEMAARPMPARAFDRIDADGDGAVTEAELQAVQDRMAEGPRGGKGRHGHGGGHGHGRGDGEGHGWFNWN